MSSNAGYVARELDRRRFQEAVAITLDKHAEAINDLRDQVRVTREFMADLSVRLDGFQQQLAMLKSSDGPVWPTEASGMLHDDGTGQ